ncbi:bifunctional diguanylate cyclase/phosphodiesterase [Sulfuritalea hydrogenivorans]|uniref:Uncharacterized protein n=1 Tax=Sulfuritalea hydrogenivorans sk43H TaxID=1223802 RepID=W0SGF7_9PROT|nr:MASE3 domain-containing protein [Sulfuritalea hydrogenivorans]BAO29835.1 hypothetical protein SUTH_02044 [Sulfuritalea hydrogenivorans sk43H]
MPQPPVADAIVVDNRSLTHALRWVGGLALLYGLLWLFPPSADLGLSRYLPLHTTLETAAIVAAMLSFGIAWNAWAESRPGNVLLIGAALFGAGLLDFAHTLSYHGMPDFVTPSSPQKGIAFWLAARYLVAAGLLAIALRPWRAALHSNFRYLLMVAVVVYVTSTYRLVLFHPDWLPDFFIAGSGLTPLKLLLEYILVAMYATAAILFYREARKGAGFNAAELFAAAAIAALSELCFTLYASVSDVFNIVGHLYKILSYGFIFRAVFVDSVQQPFQALNVALEKEMELSAEQHSFVRTLNMLDEAVLEITADGRIVRANQGWWQLIGRIPMANFQLLDSMRDEDRDSFRLYLLELTDGRRDEFHGRFRFSGAQTEKLMDCRFVAERAADGHVAGLRGVLRDITQSHQQERHIAHMALHDALTNLPNRALLEDRIHKAIQLAERSDQHVAVCLIDLDHFKNINDAHGHKTGDALLVKLAQVIKGNLGEGDTLARWSGDEFVILLPKLPGAELARQTAQRLVAAMHQTFELGGLSVNITFSMGVALYPDDGKDGEALLAQADRAMFHAKSQGRNNFQMFGEMAEKGLGKTEFDTRSRLAQAIRDRQISVWYQPLVAARPHRNGGARLAGVEALARWHDEKAGWISPAVFIPMAENLGLIGELGDLVRRQALEQFRHWRTTHPQLHIALNISKRQLFAANFIDVLKADMESWGIPHTAVTLEITESVAMMDVEFADERLRQLSAAGFTLSIDDFGTGYASLSQLHELPVGELKIDISFVRRIHSPEGLRMVQAIVSMAQALELRTVAEGIEDEATAATLRKLGVDILQGYHFGRPCTAEEFIALPLFNPAPALHSA